MLRRTCVALLASTLLATPAVARDKTLYLGVEAGPMWSGETDIDIDIQGTERDFLEIDHKLGYDVGLIFGYDAGIRCTILRNRPPGGLGRLDRWIGRF